MHHFIFMMFSLLVIIGLQVSVQSAARLSERSIRRNFLSELTVPNGMTWGSWGYKDMCPAGTYAAGFSLRVEEPSHILNDDTALNGIRLHCVNVSKGYYAEVQSVVGHWGKWTKIKWCPSGFLTAFQLRVQSSQGIKDDTAANNIRFKCSQGPLVEGDGTAWGEWGDWSPLCQGKGICGITTRVEHPQGMRDDTALNDVRMLCCD
ncbi:vitelline membrane outer layer protein 1-like [Labeo rohita]|uniref:vitelline membrane outer layer protein 1-like n=1 Tax=Labeo rohita TaxID=84645 RepID=UPI0021E32D7A|nr:vitelline membrane outer layer protein 1-like [Labeo rohita]